MIDFGDTREFPQFHLLVRTIVLKAAYVAATSEGVYVPRRFTIVVSGSPRDGTYVDLADASAALFRNDGLVPRRIDVAVGNVRGDTADVRIVVADAGPCTFAESWNRPEGYGPFRIVNWSRVV